jgi:hypothetical protein
VWSIVAEGAGLGVTGCSVGVDVGGRMVGEAGGALGDSETGV